MAEESQQKPIQLVPQAVQIDATTITQASTDFITRYSQLVTKGVIPQEHFLHRLGQLYAASRIRSIKLEQETLRDSLTGLPNFKGSSIVAEILAKRGKAHGQIVLDIRGFGALNNTYGMPVGDQVLKEFAVRLENTLYHDRGEENDVVTHYDLQVVQDMAVRSHGEHGDEFHIYLPSIETEEQLEAVCKKLLKAFETPLIVNKNGKSLALTVGISVGAAIADGTMSVQELALALSDEVARIKSTHPDGGYSIFRAIDRPLRRTRGASKSKKTTGK